MSDRVALKPWGRVPIDLVADPSCPHMALRCYVVLSQFQGEREACWPSVDTVANNLGVTRKSATVGIRWLVTHGWILSRRRGLGKTNVYRVLYPVASHLDENTVVTSDENTVVTSGCEDSGYILGKDHRNKIIGQDQNTPPNPPRGGSRAASTTPLGKSTQKCVARFCELYKTQAKHNPTISHGRIAGQMKHWLKTYSESEVIGVIEFFFATKDRRLFGFTELAQRFDSLAPLAVGRARAGPVMKTCPVCGWRGGGVADCPKCGLGFEDFENDLAVEERIEWLQREAEWIQQPNTQYWAPS